MKRPVKILITGNVFFPLDETSSRGGIEKFATDLFFILNKYPEKYEAYLVGSRDSYVNHPNFICWDGDSRELMGSEGRDSKFYNTTPILNMLKDKVVPLGIDVIISNFTNIRPIKALLTAEIPIVQFTHSILVYRNDGDYYNRLKEIKKQHQFSIFTVSEYVRNNEESATGPGLIDDVLGFTYPTIDHGFNPNPGDYFIFVGRLSKEKYIDYLVNVFDGIPDKLLIVGAKPSTPASEVTWFEEHVQSVVDRNPNITLLGQKSHDEVIELVKNAKALIHPTNDEAFCLATFEAQKLGCPVVLRSNNTISGPESYMIEGKTFIRANLYRQRWDTAIATMRDAMKQAATLDRKFIYDHFQSNFSEEKYLREFDLALNIGE